MVNIVVNGDEWSIIMVKLNDGMMIDMCDFFLMVING